MNLFLSFSLSLLLSLSCQARTRTRGYTPQGGPPTLVYDSITTGNNAAQFGQASSSYYAAEGLYNDSVSRKIGQVSVRLTWLAGDISGKTFTVKIWSMVGGAGSSLSSILATSNGVVGSNSWNNTVVAFTFSTAYTTSSSTNYSVTIDEGGVDAVNTVQAYFNSVGVCPSPWPSTYSLYQQTLGQQAQFAGFNAEMQLYTVP